MIELASNEDSTLQTINSLCKIYVSKLEWVLIYPSFIVNIGVIHYRYLNFYKKDFEDDL